MKLTKTRLQSRLGEDTLVRVCMEGQPTLSDEDIDSINMRNWKTKTINVKISGEAWKIAGETSSCSIPPPSLPTKGTLLTW